MHWSKKIKYDKYFHIIGYKYMNKKLKNCTEINCKLYGMQLFSLMTSNDWINMCVAWCSHNICQHVSPSVWLTKQDMCGKKDCMISTQITKGPNMHHYKGPALLNNFILWVQLSISSLFMLQIITIMIFISPKEMINHEDWILTENTDEKFAVPTAADSLKSAWSLSYNLKGYWKRKEKKMGRKRHLYKLDQERASTATKRMTLGCEI